MIEAISMEEVELAIRQLKCKKAQGPDGVTNDKVKNFGLLTKRTLLKLFNESWKTGTVPAMWKKATIIPIHKKGKDKIRKPKQLPTYQPSELLGKTSRKGDQQKTTILLRRQQSSVTNTNLIQKAQKHGRSACSYCPRDRECIPRKEEGYRRLL